MNSLLVKLTADCKDCASQQNGCKQAKIGRQKNVSFFLVTPSCMRAKGT